MHKLSLRLMVFGLSSGLLTGAQAASTQEQDAGQNRLPDAARSGLPLPQAAPQASPAVVRGPYLQMGTHERLTIRWRTDQPSDAVVWYGPDSAHLNQIVWIEGSRTEHVAHLSGLTPNTSYVYAVGYSGGILAGSNFVFTTAPLPGSEQPVRFWALGDSGTGDSRARSVRDAFVQYNAGARLDFWLMLGDNAYPDGTDSQYQATLFNVYPELLRAAPLWPTLGNHDMRNADSPTQSGVYYDIFSLPQAAEAGGLASNTEAYYSFDYANLHIICLDSADTDRSPSGPMFTWLQADLAQARASATVDWLIAFWHHAPYSKGSHDSDTERELIEMRERAVPLLEDAGVDLVLAGHSHSYERSYLLNGHLQSSDTLTPSMILDGGSGNSTSEGAYRKSLLGLTPHSGTVYVVAGNAGSVQEGPLDHPAMIMGTETYGSMVIDVQGLLLEVKMLDNTGTFRDSFTLRKGVGPIVPTPGEPRLEEISDESITIRWQDVAENETGYEIQRSLDAVSWQVLHVTGPNEIGYPDATIESGKIYYYRLRTKTSEDVSPFTMVLEADPVTATGCVAPPELIPKTVLSRVRTFRVGAAAGLVLLVGLAALFVRRLLRTSPHVEKHPVPPRAGIHTRDDSASHPENHL